MGLTPADCLGQNSTRLLGPLPDCPHQTCPPGRCPDRIPGAHLCSLSGNWGRGQAETRCRGQGRTTEGRAWELARPGGRSSAAVSTKAQPCPHLAFSHAEPPTSRNVDEVCCSKPPGLRVCVTITIGVNMSPFLPPPTPPLPGPVLSTSSCIWASATASVPGLPGPPSVAHSWVCSPGDPVAIWAGRVPCRGANVPMSPCSQGPCGPDSPRDCPALSPPLRLPRLGLMDPWSNGPSGPLPHQPCRPWPPALHQDNQAPYLRGGE